MKRVMIIGDAGSGKSTLARWLGAQTGLPVYHLDQVFWMPDWTPRPEVEKLAMVAQIEAQEQWIIEGNISATFENRIARSDTLVWLDLPVTLRLRRVMWRTFVHRGRSRSDMPEGCIQRFDHNTYSFLRFIWRDRHHGQRRMAACRVLAGEGVNVKHLSSRRDVAAFQRAMTQE